MAEHTRGSNHIRYLLEQEVLRLSTTAPVGWVRDERLFRVERPLHFFLGPDESFATEIAASLDHMLDHTIAEWQHWVRGLATPVRSEEHTSELQSLMRISYAVFGLKNKRNQQPIQ